MIAILLRADGNRKLNDSGTNVLCFCKQFCWVNSLANKNKAEQWEPQFLRKPTLEKVRIQRSHDACPAVPGNLHGCAGEPGCLRSCAQRPGHQGCIPAGQDITRTDQVSSAPALTQKLWSGGPGDSGWDNSRWDCERLPMCLGQPAGAVQCFTAHTNFSSGNQRCPEEAGDRFAMMIQNLDVKTQETFSG